MFGVSKILLLKKMNTLFIKDALNSSKTRVNSFMMLQKIIFQISAFEHSIHERTFISFPQIKQHNYFY